MDNNNDPTNRPLMKPVEYKPLKSAFPKPILNILDSLFSFWIVAPCVVGFWRGTWQLFDIYQDYFPVKETFTFSFVFQVMCVVIQDSIYGFFDKTLVEYSTLRRIGRHLYTYIFGVMCAMTWRGGWAIVDYYLRIETNEAGTVLKDNSGMLMVVTVLSFVCVVALKSVTNCVAPPFVICVDSIDDTFVIPTWLKAKVSEKTSLYVLDCLFSVLVIGNLVVLVWRGGWALLDIFLFPENEVWSAWASLIVGYAAVAIAFMLQPFMRWLCDRITGIFRLLAADLFLIFSLIGTINVWRGIWNLLNIYLLPDNLELSCWLTHWVCLIILILLGCSNSLLVRGVYIDGEEPAGKCVVFPCYYLRLIFPEQKLKKPPKTELSNVKPCENHIVSVLPPSYPQTLEVNYKECVV